MARGVAVVGMFVAHTAPSAGPGGVLMVSEYFPFPLFALLMGAGAELVARRMAVRRHLVESLVRGVALVLLGWALTQAGAQVLVVLGPLGVFAALAWLVARLPTWLLSLIVLGGIGLTPWTMETTRPVWSQAYWGTSDTPAALVDVLANPYYPLPLIFAAAALGVVFLRFALPESGERPARSLRTAFGVTCLAVSAAILVAGRAGLVTVGANESSWLVTGTSLLMALGVAMLCMVLAEVLPGLVAPLAQVGAMAFTLYSLHILWLAFWVRVLRPGERDDTWINVVGMTVASLVLAVLWHALKVPGRWWRGPLEGAVGVLCAVAGRAVEPVASVTSARPAERSAGGER